MSPRNLLLALLVPLIGGVNFLPADDAVKHVPALLLGVLGSGLSNTVLKKIGPLPAWNLTVWQSATVIPAMVVLSAIFDHGQAHAIRHISVTAVLAILYLAVLATGLGNFLWYRLIQQVGP